MPKFYKLDIKNCDKALLGPVGKLDEFLIMDGQYELDFDVLEEHLPVDVCNAHRYETPYAHAHLEYFAKYMPEKLDAINSLPLGLNRDQIPKGAILTEL